MMLFNQPRALEAMRRHELDVLIATSAVNVMYFTDYSNWADDCFKEYMTCPGASSNREQTFAVFPSQGDPALVVPTVVAIDALDGWVKELHVFGEQDLEGALPRSAVPEEERRLHDLLHGPVSPTPIDALLEILRARRLTDARIGLEIEGLPRAAEDAVRAALPKAMFKDCSNLIRWLRMVKTGEAISLLRRSAEINEQAAMESLALARPGCLITDLIQNYRARIAELGAEFNHFDFGPGGYGMGSGPNLTLKEGAVSFTDFGCRYRGYFSDAGATLALGEMPRALSDRYAILHDAVLAGVEAMQPGARASAVHGAMSRVVERGGIPLSPPSGHGIGLEVRDYPILVADNKLRLRDDCLDVPSDLPLESDMVLNIEAGALVLGVGSIQIEKNFLVTADGNEPLIPQDRTRPVQPGSSAADPVS